MRKVHFTPDQMCVVKRLESEAMKSSNQAHLLITLAILIDCLEWTPDDVEWFTEKYEEFLKAYNDGQEDLEQLNKNIYEYCGIAIMESK